LYVGDTGVPNPQEGVNGLEKIVEESGWGAKEGEKCPAGFEKKA